MLNYFQSSYFNDFMNVLKWFQNASEENEISIYFIDMELIDSGSQSVVILAVASNLAISSQMHYALGTSKCKIKFSD